MTSIDRNSRPASKHPEHASRVELVFILDASGSMSGLEDDTIGGFNAMIEQNREESGEALVSTVLFNHGTTVLHDRIDIREVPKLTRRDYRCQGCTALLDAVGGAIERIDLVQRVQPAGYKADRVLFVITTDGMENASRTFTYPQVKRQIVAHQEQGWEFLFIGANIDAAKEAGNLGIRQDHAAEYIADERGTEVLFQAVAGAVNCMRTSPSASVTASWRADIDRDTRTRGK